MIKSLLSLGLGVGLVLIIAGFILFPIAVIWSLNTLFPVLNIPVTLDTWLATLLLGLFIRSTVEVTKKD
jgi:hypothetical protein